MELAGIRLSCRIWPGSGPGLLCLHGLASNARWWDLMAARLAPPTLMVAPDLRGHGQSARPDHGYTFSDVGGDLLQLLEVLSMPDPVVVGHSWGASVALWLAAHLPEVRGVVCVDGGVVDLREVFGSDWDTAREAMRPPVMADLDEARVRGFATQSGLSQEAGVDAVAAAMLGNFERGSNSFLRPRLGMERHLEIARSLYELDLEKLWAAVRCPVLYLLADDSSPMAERKRRHAQRAVTLAGGPTEVAFLAGHHDLPLQHPQAVAEVVARFYMRVTAAVDGPRSTPLPDA